MFYVVTYEPDWFVVRVMLLIMSQTGLCFVFLLTSQTALLCVLLTWIRNSRAVSSMVILSG